MSKIRLQNVRLAFPEIFQPKAVNGEGEPAYSATFILAQDHPQLGAIEKAIKEVAEEKWKDKAAAQLARMRKTDKVCLRDGDDKPYAGFQGNLYISARNKSRPTVVDRDLQPLTREDGKPYAGCYVDAVVELWAQDNQYGQRINASLRGVQFRAHGEAFSGGGAASANDFEDLSDLDGGDLV